MTPWEFIKDFLCSVISLEMAGSLLLVWLGYKLANTRAYEQRRVTAAIEFKNIFLRELRGLYPVTVKWPSGHIETLSFFKSKIPVLHAAVINFRPYIHFLKRNGFDKAWNKFSGIDSSFNSTEYDFFQYTGAKINGKPEEKPSILLKEHVDRLLKYANFK